MASTTWWPQVNTGFKELIGSWKIIAILFPRIWCNFSRSSFSRSSPSSPFSENKILPELYLAGGEGISCKTERAVIVFPEPDSPTTATISPRSTVKEIFFIAWTVSF